VSIRRRKLLEPDAFKLLEKYGMPVVRYGFARTPEEAREIAREIGLPVVLKVVSSDIIHKTDVGGVLLGLKTLEEVERGFNTIVENVKAKAPNAVVDGVLVQEMAPPGGLEVIVGAIRDPTFGHVLMFGLGGVFVEVLRDVTFRVIPITEEDAWEMIGEIKSSKVLEGYRGRPPRDRKAIVDILMALSKLLEENQQIEEVDLNPVMVYEKGARVVDVRIMVRE